MNHPQQRLRKALQHVLALFGLAAVLGVPTAAQAEIDAARAALDARVALVREALPAAAATGDTPPDATAQWLNWPNWGNWNNWPNWGNWVNGR